MNKILGLALAGAAFLGGCGDDKIAGGTGSDFPQPSARLLDTALQPIAAGVWRLWKVEKDSATAKYQVLDSNGFSLPASGLWIVEAWLDTASSGRIDGLSKVPFSDTVCTRTITYLSSGDSSKVGVLSCPDLLTKAPSLSFRSSKPLGVGVFEAADTIRMFTRVPNKVQAYRFMVWSIRWDTVKTPNIAQTTGTDSVLISLRDKRISALPGIVDIALPSGDWMFEGWVAQPSDSGLYDWNYPVNPRWVDSTVLRACFEDSAGFCMSRPGPLIRNKEADVIFVERIR